ncbi:hypothetical protein [Microbacterium sp. GXF6406]
MRSRGHGRRVALGAAAGVVIALAAATGVSAYWQAQQTVNLDTVSSGDLSVSANWVGGTPNWSGVYPGQSVDAKIAVAVQGEGTNLEWTVNAQPSGLDPAFTFQAWSGECGTGGALPASGSPQTLIVCVRFTLAPGTSGSYQGLNFTPSVTITAEQGN